jgi:hypothetical protein
MGETASAGPAEDEGSTPVQVFECGGLLHLAMIWE